MLRCSMNQRRAGLGDPTETRRGMGYGVKSGVYETAGAECRMGCEGEGIVTLRNGCKSHRVSDSSPHSSPNPELVLFEDGTFTAPPPQHPKRSISGEGRTLEKRC